MKSPLESYIEQHRDRLDVASFDDESHWNAIAGSLDARKKRHLLLWRTAAIIILLVSSASVTGYFFLKHPTGRPAGISLADISPEMAEEEKTFRLAIMEKMDQVSQHHITPVQSLELSEELHQLDVQYACYLEDMQERGNHPKVLRGMIRVYEQKIKILEKILLETEKNECHENHRKSI